MQSEREWRWVEEEPFDVVGYWKEWRITALLGTFTYEKAGEPILLVEGHPGKNGEGPEDWKRWALSTFEEYYNPHTDAFSSHLLKVRLACRAIERFTAEIEACPEKRDLPLIRADYLKELTGYLDG